MSVAHDVMEGAAVFRRKSRGILGIDQIEGDDLLHYILQGLKHRAVRKVIFAPFGFQEFRDEAVVDVVKIGVHGDHLPRRQDLAGVAGRQNGGDLELPGQEGHMAGGTAGVGDDGRGLGHDGDIFG